MTVGHRIEARRKALGIPSQSELARLAGLKQSTLSGLIRKDYRWSPHLPALARTLRTSVDFLVGDTSDPEAAAPQSSITPQDEQLLTLFAGISGSERRSLTTIASALAAAHTVASTVHLPREDALAAMFEGLLDGIDATLPLAERARQLAQRLPTALTQLRDVLPAQTEALPAPAASAAARADLATADRGPPR